MASDAGYRYCGLVCSFDGQVTTQLGLLAVPGEQRAVGGVGSVGPRLCIDCFADLSCGNEYPRGS